MGVAEKLHCTEEILPCGRSRAHAPCGGDFAIRGKPRNSTVRRRFSFMGEAERALRAEKIFHHRRSRESAILGADFSLRAKPDERTAQRRFSSMGGADGWRRTKRKIDCERCAVRAWGGAGCVRGTVQGSGAGRRAIRAQCEADFATRGKPRAHTVRSRFCDTGEAERTHCTEEIFLYGRSR